MTTYRHSGLICTDHTLDVPLDHARPDGPAMFVDREHSLETARLVRGLRTWVSEAHAHDGVKADPAVLDRLITMADGKG